MTSEPLNGADEMTASDTASFSTLLTDWNAAIVANDPEAIGRFAEPDWVFVGENGIFPGDQFLDAVAKGQVTHDFMTSDVHDVFVRRADGWRCAITHLTSVAASGVAGTSPDNESSGASS